MLCFASLLIPTLNLSRRDRPVALTASTVCVHGEAAAQIDDADDAHRPIIDGIGALAYRRSVPMSGHHTEIHPSLVSLRPASGGTRPSDMMGA